MVDLQILQAVAAVEYAFSDLAHASGDKDISQAIALEECLIAQFLQAFQGNSSSSIPQK